MEMTEDSRSTDIELKANESTEMYSVRWQNRSLPLKVIHLSIDHVLLNPDSHRIRAQIESHSDRQRLEHDPYSVAAQDAIAQILRDTLDFDKLADNLKEDGQLEPGIITHKGVLINGNTRAVALRGIGEGYIDVAVLPKSATSGELTQLEARLQLARDYKQDYTLTNELLFIKEQLDEGVTKEDLALLLGKAQSRSRQHMQRGVSQIESALRILQHIREIQEMSNGTIPLIDFDPHESALHEADRIYASLEGRNRAEAERVRSGRMAGVLVGVTYRNLRNWDSDDFLVDHVVEELDDQRVVEAVQRVAEGAAPERDPSFNDESLAILEDDVDKTSDTLHVDPNALLATVASAYDNDDDVPVTDGLTKGELFGHVRAGITQAAEDREQERRDQRRQFDPIRFVLDARQKVDHAERAFAKAAEEGFKRGKFKIELRRLRKQVEELEASLEQDGQNAHD